MLVTDCLAAVCILQCCRRCFLRSHMRGKARLQACLTLRVSYIMSYSQSASGPTHPLTISVDRWPPTRGAVTLNSRRTSVARQRVMVSRRQCQQRQQSPPESSLCLEARALHASSDRSVMSPCWQLYLFVLSFDANCCHMGTAIKILCQMG